MSRCRKSIQEPVHQDVCRTDSADRASDVEMSCKHPGGSSHFEDTPVHARDREVGRGKHSWFRSHVRYLGEASEARKALASHTNFKVVPKTLTNQDE